MYELNLTKASVPAQVDLKMQEISIGGLLRKIAGENLATEALVEVTQVGAIGRR